MAKKKARKVTRRKARGGTTIGELVSTKAAAIDIRIIIPGSLFERELPSQATRL